MACDRISMFLHILAKPIILKQFSTDILQYFNMLHALNLDVSYMHWPLLLLYTHILKDYLNYVTQLTSLNLDTLLYTMILGLK